MNLTEIQVELRNIQKHIDNLHNEIEKLKAVPEDKQIDFDKIDKLAIMSKIRRDKICSMPAEIKGLFFSALSGILMASSRDIEGKLLYLTRLSFGCGFESSSEELYKKGCKIENIIEIIEGIGNYKTGFLVESFILLGNCKTIEMQDLNVIAEIAKIYGCNIEEIKTIACVAKGYLTSDMDILLTLPIPASNRWGNMFNDYIPREWFIKNRIACGEICTKKIKEYTWQTLFETKIIDTTIVPNRITNMAEKGKFVKKRDQLCEYVEEKREGDAVYFSTSKYIYANADGILFILRWKDKKENSENISFYVVSYFDIYKDFETWFMSRQDEGLVEIIN